MKKLCLPIVEALHFIMVAVWLWLLLESLLFPLRGWLPLWLWQGWGMLLLFFDQGLALRL
jgi:hypothetical protein